LRVQRVAPGGFIYVHTMPQTEPSTGVKSLLNTVSRYISLLIEDTRLNVAEKITRLVSAAALFLLLTIVITIAMVFMSIVLSLLLANVFGPLAGFTIVSGFYVILGVVLYLARKSILINPIARFISSMMLDAPTDETPSANHSTTEGNA